MLSCNKKKVLRAVLNFLFLRKDFARTKAQKIQKAQEVKKGQEVQKAQEAQEAQKEQNAQKAQKLK